MNASAPATLRGERGRFAGDPLSPRDAASLPPHLETLLRESRGYPADADLLEVLDLCMRVMAHDHQPPYFYPHLVDELRRELGLAYAREMQLTPAQMRLMVAARDLYGVRAAS